MCVRARANGNCHRRFDIRLIEPQIVGHSRKLSRIRTSHAPLDCVCVCVLHRVQPLAVVHLVSVQEETVESIVIAIDRQQVASGNDVRRAACALPLRKANKQPTNEAATTNKCSSSSNINFSLHFHLQALFTLFNVCLELRIKRKTKALPPPPCPPLSHSPPEQRKPLTN